MLHVPMELRISLLRGLQRRRRRTKFAHELYLESSCQSQLAVMSLVVIVVIAVLAVSHLVMNPCLLPDPKLVRCRGELADGGRYRQWGSADISSERAAASNRATCPVGKFSHAYQPCAQLQRLASSSCCSMDCLQAGTSFCIT